MINYPSNNMSNLQKFMYLKSMEKEIKSAIKELQAEVKQTLMKENDLYSLEDTGSLQRITKVTTKPAESLQVFLEENGLLEICKNDEIDLGKVKQLIEAGILDEDEVNEHLIKTESDYIKFNGI